MAHRAESLSSVKVYRHNGMPDRLARLCRRVHVTPAQYADLEADHGEDWAAIEAQIKADTCQPCDRYGPRGCPQHEEDQT